MDRRKELKMQYKMRQPDMGVFAFECIPEKKMYIGWSKDIQATFNSNKFRMEMGSSKNRQLQQAYNCYGEDAIRPVVLALLKYDDKEPDRDYTEDLEALKEEWKEKPGAWEDF